MAGWPGARRALPGGPLLHSQPTQVVHDTQSAFVCVLCAGGRVADVLA